MARILANNLLINGVKTEFANTYQDLRIKQASSILGLVMDLSVTATNRRHDFAHINASPHMTLWQRGEGVPADAMDAVQWEVKIYEWARRVGWSKFDRKDDQTDTMFEAARMVATSAALLPERFFFDVLTGGTDTLPGVLTGSDGTALHSSSSRFAVGGGNQITATGLVATSDILQDYYLALNRFRDFQDGKGQPLISEDIISQGVVIVYPLELTQIMEATFLQTRIAAGVTAVGHVAGAGDTAVGGAAQTNVVQETNKGVTLWASPRLTDVSDYYYFLRGAPGKAIFYVNREGLQEFSSLEGDNNGDHTRDTGEEYVQWEERSGAGVALPYSTIKVNTA